MWWQPEVQGLSFLDVIWVCHGVACNFVVVWEEVPPVEIAYLLLISFMHVYLVMQTIKVLSYDEHWAEYNEDCAGLAIDVFIGGIYDEETHVSKVVDAIQVQNSFRE